MLNVMRLEICHDANRLTSLVLLETATGLLMTAGQDLGYTFHLRWEMLFAGREKKIEALCQAGALTQILLPRGGQREVIVNESVLPLFETPGFPLEVLHPSTDLTQSYSAYEI